jgi:hypothetical protein
VTNATVLTTIVLGTMTNANELYMFELLYKSGDSIDLQYNGIVGPMAVNIIVGDTDHVNTINTRIV